MKTLHVAFKVGDDTAYKARLLEKDVLVYSGVCELSNVERISKYFSYSTALIYYLLNRIKCLLILRKNDRIFSVINRNKINEWALKRIIKKRNIEKVFVHWTGYGFLPTGSILELQKSLNVQIFVVNHDWLHLTSGCHVPADCQDWFGNCQNCKFLRTPIVSNKEKDLKGFSAVSEWQAQFISKKFGRDVILAPYIEQSSYEHSRHIHAKGKVFKRTAVLVVGINSLNSDNKGLSFINLLNKGELREKLFLTSIGSQDAIGADVELPRLERDKLLEIMRVNEIVIVPSWLETFSMVSLEALNQGCKLVVRKGLPPEEWQHPNIVLSARRTNDSLLEALQKVIRSND